MTWFNETYPLTSIAKEILETDECFYCCELIDLREDARIWWRGSSGDILLHARCAQTWIMHLAKDALFASHPSYAKLGQVGSLNENTGGSYDNF